MIFTAAKMQKSLILLLCITNTSASCSEEPASAPSYDEESIKMISGDSEEPYIEASLDDEESIKMISGDSEEPYIGAPSPSISLQRDDIAVTIPTETTILKDLDFGACWNSLLKTEGCIVESAGSVFGDKFKVSQKCCDVVDGIVQCLGNSSYFNIIRALCLFTVS